MSGFAQSNSAQPTANSITTRLNRVVNDCRRIQETLEGFRYQLGLGEPGDPQPKGEHPPENITDTTARIENIVEKIANLLGVIKSAIV